MVRLYFLVAIVVGIAVYLLTVILLFRTGERQDTLQRRIDTIGGRVDTHNAANEELVKPFAERVIKPIISALARKTSGKNNVSSEAGSSRNRKDHQKTKMLYQAGFAVTPAEYDIIRLLVIGGVAVVLAVMALAFGGSAKNALLGASMGLFIGYTAMRYILTSAIKKRKRLMEQQLPDVLDLLSVSVEAGLGFEQAINHVTSNMEGPLIDEFTVTSREMSMGRTRKDALTLLGERCDIDEIKNFAGALAQASQLGISIKNVLRSQAAAMRQSRRAKVQEKAMKVSVKMLFPMVAFIFPVIFIVLLGPAVVNVIKAFAS